MPLSVLTKGEDLSVELLLWRYYGPKGSTSAMVTATLALNPGLSRFGPVLPPLTKLKLADLPAEPVRPARVGVNIFDDDDED